MAAAAVWGSCAVAGAFAWRAAAASAAETTAEMPGENDAGNADRWVESGRDALRSGSAPWYDEEADRASAWKFPAPSQSPAAPRESPPATDGLLFVWLAYALIAAVLATLAYFLIRAFLDRETSAAKTKAVVAGPAPADHVDALPVGLLRSESDLLGAARRHYEAGNYSEAIIYLFSHELLELDRHELIRLAKGKTNRQYLRELASRTDLRGLLAETVERFERVFFGAQPLDRESFDACWQRLPQFQELVARFAP